MIEFESVSKTFRDGTAAVVDLSLTVPSGKITVIVGPSGCGKTTTLRMVNRMLEPTSGRILWDGSALRSRRKTTLRRQMGYVIQSGGLFPHRTVIENIGTVPGLLGWSKDKTRKRSQELLTSVGLDRKLADRYPSQLSGGQQQRVGVARALAADPLVLLMDEPFSAVDPVVRSELHDFFLGLQREISKTIILITHDIDEAIKLGDQVAILRVGGRLAQVGTPQQLLEEPADAFVEGFIGKDRGFRSLSFLPANGLRLERVDVVREVGAAGSGAPTLVVDGDARPVGWAHRDQPGHVVALGSTFVPESDTVRTALDSALTSPYGLAVAVAAGTGRFAGVVNAQQILDQVAEARTAAAEPISVQEVRRESEPGPDPVEGAEDDTELRRPEPAEESADDMRPEPVEGQDDMRPKLVEGQDDVRPEPVEGQDDMRPEPVEGQDDMRPEPAEGQVNMRPEPAEGQVNMRPEPVEGSDNMPPEPVEGSEQGASTDSTHMADEPGLRPEPIEGPEDTRPEPVEGSSKGMGSTGSTRIDELQLSAESVEGREDWAATESVPLVDEREPDRGHVR